MSETPNHDPHPDPRPDSEGQGGPVEAEPDDATAPEDEGHDAPTEAVEGPYDDDDDTDGQ